RFNPPEAEDDVSHLAGEINVPQPLRRRALHDELEARRFAHAAAAPHRPGYFGLHPVLELAIDGVTVAPDEIAICSLETWRPAPDKRKYKVAGGKTAVQDIRAAVDPVLGRVTVPAGDAVKTLTVSY